MKRKMLFNLQLACISLLLAVIMLAVMAVPDDSEPLSTFIIIIAAKPAIMIACIHVIKKLWRRWRMERKVNGTRNICNIRL